MKKAGMPANGNPPRRVQVGEAAMQVAIQLDPDFAEQDVEPAAEV
jgi:hypothetical protein